MPVRNHYIALAIFMLALLAYCLHRDVSIERHYTGDLRNRVVGARLQMDGMNPYSFRWYPANGLRYYDPIRIDTTYANAITASPFFHHLLYPIANLDQRRISIIWLALEYVLLLMTAWMAFSLARTRAQGWLVVIVTGMFLMTKAWMEHVAAGQIYIFYPFLCMLFLFSFKKRNDPWYLLVAGLTAIVLVLSRPTALLIFLPCLILLKQFTFREAVLFALPVAILVGYSVFDKQERNYWIGYGKAIAAQIKDHQSHDREERARSYVPVRYARWEGWDQDQIDLENRFHPLHIQIEQAGIQQLASRFLNVRIPYPVLGIGSLIIIGLLSATFFLRHHSLASGSLALPLIFGFCLYMICDLLSPVLRSQYYTVQWLFALLICAACYKPGHRLVYGLLLLGLLLNILARPTNLMRHTLGEYLILFVLLWIGLAKKGILEE